MTFGAFCGILCILISIWSAGMTFLGNRRRKLLFKHLIASREHQQLAVNSLSEGDRLIADLHMDAAAEELEKARKYC